MADVHAAIRGYLAGVSAITTLVGTRIYAVDLPQGVTLPAVTVQVFASEHLHDISGAAGLAFMRVRVTAHDDDLVDANTLADAIREALQGKSGTVGSEFIQSVQCEGRVEQRISPRDGSDQWRYQTSQSFRIGVTESIPTF